VKKSVIVLLLACGIALGQSWDSTSLQDRLALWHAAHKDPLSKKHCFHEGTMNACCWCGKAPIWSATQVQHGPYLFDRETVRCVGKDWTTVLLPDGSVGVFKVSILNADEACKGPQ